ncbi:MAG TPA: prepilin peptidase, partial [Spirochaetota bacterium]|nr:prepilin peptidase [Spirochaetota bacterium]
TLHILTFIIGTFIASFFMTLAERSLTEKKSSLRDILFSRSRCTSCGKNISPLGLVPVFGYILARGKCKCGSRISINYPLSEILCGLILTASVYFNGLSLIVICEGIFLCNSIVIAYYDIKFMRISNLSIAAALIIAMPILYFSDDPFSHLKVFIAAAAILLLFGYVFAGSIGWGDIKFIAVIALFSEFSELIIILESAILSGCAVGLIIALLKTKNLKIKLPFAPFITAGLFITHFAGNQIYKAFMLFIQQY